MNRQRHRVMLMSCVLLLLDEDDFINSKGGQVGRKIIRRQRKFVESMITELGCCAVRAYRMKFETFNKLHDLLKDKLEDEFNPRSNEFDPMPNGFISTKLRLSAAIRFFAGGSVYDIMLTHGISRQSVYDSIYGVVDVIHRETALSFNKDGAEFPSHREQEEIADGFAEMSGAGFKNVMMALDGMLVWTIQPSKKECDYLKIGQRCFHCYRKDKYGWLLLAGCDHQTKFRWCEINHPSSTSDYLAWTTSKVGSELKNDESNLIKKGFVIVGDNAFVENMTMATPVPGLNISEVEDSYNFYVCQLRITIERAFGILVHRWGILRRPLSLSSLKVPTFVSALMKLHNFCVDNDSRHTSRSTASDEATIQRHARRARKRNNNKTSQNKAVSLDDLGRPKSLLGCGHHFLDEPSGKGRRPIIQELKNTPMRKMIKHIRDCDFRRPTISNTN